MKLKQSDSVRTQLGLTQEDMALYLNVSRGQLALYETNKRDLPFEAKLKLAKIENFLSQPIQNKTTVPNKENQLLLLQKEIEQQALENEIQKLVLEKKIKTIEKKYNQSLNLLRVIDYLQEKEKKTETEETLLQVFQSQAHTTLTQNGLHIQELHKIKLQAVLNHNEQLNDALLK